MSTDAAPGAALVRTEQREIVRALQRLDAQLAGRMEGELSDADRVAVRSAVAMAIVEGFDRGRRAAVYAAEVAAKRKGVELYIDMGESPRADAVDFWAQREAPK